MREQTSSEPVSHANGRTDGWRDRARRSVTMESFDQLNSVETSSVPDERTCARVKLDDFFALSFLKRSDRDLGLRDVFSVIHHAEPNQIISRKQQRISATTTEIQDEMIRTSRRLPELLWRTSAAMEGG